MNNIGDYIDLIAAYYRNFRFFRLRKENPYQIKKAETGVMSF
jgi:hypothetical protein